MAVRLEVELKALKGKNRGKVVKCKALLNSGYESETPEIVIPIDVAEKLGFLPELPEETRMEEYYSVSGKFVARRIPDAVEVKLADRSVVASAVIVDFEREVLLSDATISELGIIILDAKRGEWRLRECSR